MFDTGLWLTAGAILGLLIMSAFFSGSETALTAASRGKLRGQADRGSKGAERAFEVTEDREKLIGALLLGNNVVNILSAALATALMTRLFGESGVAFATDLISRMDWFQVGLGAVFALVMLYIASEYRRRVNDN